MIPYSLAEVAEAHQQRQARLTAEAVALLVQAIRRGLRGDATSWHRQVMLIAASLLGLQQQAAALADGYVTEALDVQGIDPDADGVVVPGSWADTTDGGGSWLRYLVYAPLAVIERERARGVLVEQAVSHASWVAQSIVVTGMEDTGRSAVQTSMMSRRADLGYVRMIVRPACSRCVILAGRRYRRADAFRRHPRCKCRHVPAPEDALGDYATDPVVYFRSLSHAEQDSTFTKSGAEAVRLALEEGESAQASLNQIVNARQGTWTVRTYGRDVRATSAGTTRRGLAGQMLADEGWQRSGGRYRRARTPRLLPDEIFALAVEYGWSREEVLRQLRRFAYII